MSTFNLSRWLRKMPQPVRVVADDKTIDVPKHGRGWKELCQTIEALEPSKLTCLDGQGAILRSTVLDGGDDKPETSPELSDVQLFAKLISEAYDKGSKVNQPLIDSIMMFLERQSQTLAKANADIEKLRNENHRLRAEILKLSAAPEVDEDQSALGILASALVQGQADAAAQVTPIKQGQKQGVPK
jgi:hypothetical protein